MINESNTSLYSRSVPKILACCLIWLATSHPAAGLGPVSAPAPNAFAPFEQTLVEPPWPERYIDPAFKYGLNLVLPQQIRKGLIFDSGYDRWEGLATVQADYFLPVKAWSDKSLFLSPRVCLTGNRESFSFGAGFRQLITSEALIGFHVFHDWVRPRRLGGDFLKEAGVGLDLQALPGRFSDLSVSINSYFPINERSTALEGGSVLATETLPTGADARLTFLMPPLIDWLDLKLDAQVHTFRGERTDLSGYKAGLTVSSRNGMFNASFAEGKDSVAGENYNVEGSVTLAFDWVDLLNGKNPFSAPYQTPSFRFSRKIRDSLYERVTRYHDLPEDRTERRVSLAASVDDSLVAFSGGFPGLPNSRVTVQVAQSPWRDVMEVVTDSRGFYSGKFNLERGKYKFRLLHKSSGQSTGVATLVVGSYTDAVSKK